MQTDAWLTDTSYPDCCPLCSQPLASGSNMCLSCGFTAHEPAGKTVSPARLPAIKQPNPITPIPARASAQHTRSKPGTIQRRPQAPSPSSSSSVQQGEGWQHESPSYEAASSLSALSLIISETPTAPPRTQRASKRQDAVDEIDTIPQPSGQSRTVQQLSGQTQAVSFALPETPLPSHSLAVRFDDLDVSGLAAVLSEIPPPIDEIDTIPEAGSAPSRALAPLHPASREVAVDAASWTVKPGSTTSQAARFIASRSPRRRHSRNFNPLDRTRWWLLRPGHIEFLLWTVGSLLLFGVTFLILLSTVLSVMLPGLQASGNFPTSTVKASMATPTMTMAATNLHLTLAGKTSLSPGAETQLQGKGFHPRATVVFLLDSRLALLDQHGKAASVQTDASGNFTISLWLGQGPGWSAGAHQIVARETADGQQANVAITISAAPITANPGNLGGGQGTPAPSANPTPKPTQPTAPTPTPEPAQPTPTPGTVPTPAPSPTSASGATVTPGAAGGTALPARTQTPGSSVLSNSLSNGNNDSLFTRLAHLNPLVWLIGICYFASLLLIGLAGLLRRRQR